MSVGGEVFFAIAALVIFWWLFDQVTKKFGTMETLIVLAIGGGILGAFFRYLA